MAANIVEEHTSKKCSPYATVPNIDEVNQLDKRQGVEPFKISLRFRFKKFYFSRFRFKTFQKFKFRFGSGSVALKFKGSGSVWVHRNHIFKVQVWFRFTTSKF